MSESSDSGRLVVDLLEAAIRVEGKGQLNIGKILRASAMSVAQSAAADAGFPDDRAGIAADLASLSDRLRTAGAPEETCERVALAATLVGRDEQSYLADFPDPYVCRRCGTMTATTPDAICERCGAHPLTFRRFRPIYWMSEYAPAEVLERLSANPDLFREAIQPLAPDRYDWKPEGTAWAATDVVRHLRDAQSVLAQRVVLMLEEDDPALAFQPVFEWTNQQTGEVESAESILVTYAESRAGTVARLRDISAEAWSRTGVHEEFGSVTLLEQASYFAAHEITHLRQLEQLARAAGDTG